MYRLTVGPPQRPMAATLCSRTPAAARAWAPETRQLCPSKSRLPRGPTVGLCRRTRDAVASTVATVAALVQTAPDSGREQMHQSTGNVKLGSEGDHAILLTDHGVKRACGVGTGNAAAPVVRCAPLPLKSCFEHGKRRVTLRRTVSIETSSQMIAAAWTSRSSHEIRVLRAHWTVRCPMFICLRQGCQLVLREGYALSG